MLKLLSTTAAQAVCAATLAQAQDYNFDVFAGSSASSELVWDGVGYDVSSDTILGFGFSRNDVFTPGFEVGLEYSQVEQEYTNFAPNSIGAQTLLVTARYNFFEHNGFEGYGGLGLGVASVTYVNTSVVYENSDTVSAAQLMLGGRYDVGTSSQVFAEYRYMTTLDDALVANPTASGDA